MYDILLKGGPAALEGVRSAETEGPPERVILAYYGRHEHYELTDETVEIDGCRLPVLRWTYSTAIAE
ncbi:DUF5988 family protein [Streptomyces sp. NPDC059373]